MSSDISLSPSEQNVATYLKMGLSNKEIDERIFVSNKTVKFHITNIFKKYGVKSRSGFLAKIHGEGDVDLREEIMSVSQSRGRVSGVNPVVPKKTPEEKIMFVSDHFKVGETLTHLHYMMKEVTKEKIDHNTVNAACNCVARLNETIDTAIKAAKFLSER